MEKEIAALLLKCPCKCEKTQVFVKRFYYQKHFQALLINETLLHAHTQTYEPFLGDQQNLEVREGEIGLFFPPFIECKPVTIPGKSQTE